MFFILKEYLSGYDTPHIMFTEFTISVMSNM
jgi:hypothetical protein